MTKEIRDAAALLHQGARTLDALHVASAQALGESLDVLVTYDRRMFDVAHAVGVPVAAPACWKGPGGTGRSTTWSPPESRRGRPSWGVRPGAP